MDGYPATVERLIQAFTRYPGIGRKSAERMALHTLNLDPGAVQALSQSLVAVIEDVRFCTVCHALTDQDICDICRDPKRSDHVICVVETFRDVIQIERSGAYHGKYHVLGGHISPLDGVDLDDLTIQALIDRVESGGISEIILALNPNTDGDVTAMHLAQRLQHVPVKISQVARGLPLGGDLEFADSLTIAKSFERRDSFHHV
jgi:recombination protein RecR